jgi:D-tagatose-1,6-bisphosphate aldolase subunit GatZ/KbaZ
VSTSLQQFLIDYRGRRGIYSVCSTQRWVIEAAMQQALDDDVSLLIEATSNQVNQEGGYTGMTPATYRTYVSQVASGIGFSEQKIIFGGDHLGPNPWRHLTAKEAMERAAIMVRDYVAAGFTKIHLDASMPCLGDPPALSDATVANRAAILCHAAESTAREAGLSAPIYIIGTEVPSPGGATHEISGLEVTSLEAVDQTLAVHRKVFAEAELQGAWRRVIALVVQPGVEFDHDTVIEYDAAKATHLKNFLERNSELVFEAHSTDYQRPPGSLLCHA